MQVLPEGVTHPLETEWGVNAKSILDGVFYSKGFIKRGVRGIIAECQFRDRVLTALPSGWCIGPGSGNDAIDFTVRREGSAIDLRVQVKMMRQEKDKPLLDKSGLPVVEIQKSNGRGKTRSYQYRDFDILAVSLWPMTKNWNDFAYACLHQLEHKPRQPQHIKTMQAIDLKSPVWSQDFAQTFERASGRQAIRATVEQLELGGTIFTVNP